MRVCQEQPSMMMRVVWSLQKNHYTQLLMSNWAKMTVSLSQSLFTWRVGSVDYLKMSGKGRVWLVLIFYKKQKKELMCVNDNSFTQMTLVMIMVSICNWRAERGNTTTFSLFLRQTVSEIDIGSVMCVVCFADAFSWIGSIN